MSRAAVYDAFGGPEVLRVTEVADAAPGAGQVAVAVRAAGLNPMDSKIRRGMMPSGEQVFPKRTGTDFAGTVSEVGEGAAYFDGTPVRVGDPVLGWGDGAVAERVIVPAGQIAPSPPEVPLSVAGALPVVGFVALSALRTVPVGPADTIFVGGAAGGVGIVYSQLALALGARVIGSASAEKQDFLRSLGVEGIEYGEGMVDRLVALAPITAVMDFHGREAVDAALEIGVPVERIIAIANHGAVAELGVGTAPRLRSAEDLAWLAGELAAGRVRLPVAAVHPLDGVVAAFEQLDGSHPVGKIVVEP